MSKYTTKTEAIKEWMKSQNPIVFDAAARSAVIISNPSRQVLEACERAKREGRVMLFKDYLKASRAKG